MGNKGERQDGGRGDGYRDLMVAVVTQQVEDAYDTKVPKGCRRQ
jgi:predicted alpha/beta superfamily hydrolase